MTSFIVLQAPNHKEQKYTSGPQITWTSHLIDYICSHQMLQFLQHFASSFLCLLYKCPKRKTDLSSTPNFRKSVTILQAWRTFHWYLVNIKFQRQSSRNVSIILKNSSGHNLNKIRNRYGAFVLHVTLQRIGCADFSMSLLHRENPGLWAIRSYYCIYWYRDCPVNVWTRFWYSQTVVLEIVLCNLYFHV